MVLQASCYCDAINFTVDEEAPGGVLCHCKTCQKLHTQSSYNIQTTQEKLKVTKGTPKVFHDKKSDVGKDVARSFCGDCGSALFSIPESMPGVAFIKVGALENAADIKPVAEIYVDTAYPHAVMNKSKHGTKHFEGMMAKEV